jgi:hypothetical protein
MFCQSSDITQPIAVVDSYIFAFFGGWAADRMADRRKLEEDIIILKMEWRSEQEVSLKT